MATTSVYIHVPFCIHRCGYCDFNTFAGLDALIPIYSKAVCREIELLSASNHERLKIGTIYFGGGTPSLLPISDIEKILSLLNRFHRFVEPVEISLEANPGTVTEIYLNQLHSLGVNRLSFGMQSANQDELELLERQHTFDDVVKAVEWSRAAGFDNLNLDLIYGLPFQETESWILNLKAALSLQPEHLSLYALTIEAGTPMHRMVEAGILPEPDQDTLADMYEAASERLADEGFIQYEISNWAREDQNGSLFSCKHNLQYWRNLPYLGLGAGAHGYIDQQRTVNASTPGEYIKKLTNGWTNTDGNDNYPTTPATLQCTFIDVDTEIGETMMMGLRLVKDGVSDLEFQRRFGVGLQQRFMTPIDRLIKIGLLEWSGTDKDILRLTQKGYLLGNQVFKEFI